MATNIEVYKNLNLSFFSTLHWNVKRMKDRKMSSVSHTRADVHITPSLLHRSRDGSFLAVSSTDGYCSFLCFSPGELGTPLKEPPTLEVFAPNSAVEKKGKKASRTSSPGTQPAGNLAQTTTPQSVAGAAAATKEPPCITSPEEKKSTPSAKPKPQPRRITLNTLEGWGKPAAPKPAAPQTPPPPTTTAAATSTPQPRLAPLTPTTPSAAAPHTTPQGKTTPKGPTPR